MRKLVGRLLPAYLVISLVRSFVKEECNLMVLLSFAFTHQKIFTMLHTCTNNMVSYISEPTLASVKLLQNQKI